MDNIGSSMSAPGCTTVMVTGGSGVSVVVRRLCNVNNIGSSISLSGCS